MRRFPLLLILFALSACGSPGHDLGRRARVECAPFARALSGIDLHGDAAGWWWQAANRYPRGGRPEVGAVLVFAPTSRLPRGHVSVVSQVLSGREILVTQANWVHSRVTADQLVRDVSPYGDWSVVRAWWPPSGTLGSTAYPVLGFIYSGQPASHDVIVRAIPRAVRVAMDD